jgi:GNAT superfamily N-acetyltransferase
VVGQRVVVRRVLRGETGPTGGPAMTDLLGVVESWGDGVTTVRDESGALTTIALRDIVSGKPVPPRPSARLRISDLDAERRALAGWPASVAQPLGEWVLRASGGYSSRANSALAVGSPGMPLEDAAAAVRAFYTGQALPAWAQVVPDSDVHLGLQALGWTLARPGEADTVFQLTSVAQAVRAVRRLLPPVVPPVSVSSSVSRSWLADDEHAVSADESAREVLEGPDEVAFVSLAPDGRAGRDQVIAKGRVSFADDWAGITNVWVSAEHRRRGLAVVVMGALLDWAAERGATTAYLQVRGDNPGALALDERLGFLTHHSYRYLAAPAG